MGFIRIGHQVGVDSHSFEGCLFTKVMHLVFSKTFLRLSNDVLDIFVFRFEYFESV